MEHKSTDGYEGRWSISPDALFRPLEGEAVILDMESRRYYGLNPVGVRVWQLLEHHGRLDPVIADLLEELEVEEDRLRRDVQALLDDLQAEGLVRRRPDP